uniref:SPX domain-containing protein n=1 Tax=Heterorhabditis bacteriophora TaxID=37862 RepID=A0A1I7XJ27_HETBA
MQQEEEDDYFTAKKAFLETEDRLLKVRVRQNLLDGKLVQLFENVQKLTDIVQKTDNHNFQ